MSRCAVDVSVSGVTRFTNQRARTVHPLNPECQNQWSMVSDSRGCGLDSNETYIILDGLDDGPWIPPDPRPDVGERTFDRILTEIRDRYRTFLGVLSAVLTFSVAVLTVSSALLIFVLTECSITELTIFMCFMAPSIILGILVERNASMADLGVDIHDIVISYNQYNYELANQLLFDSKCRAAYELELRGNKASKLLGFQILMFVISLMVVLIMETRS